MSPALIVRDATLAAITLLHEVGHAELSAAGERYHKLGGEGMSGVGVLRREALAWRYAVGMIRKYRPLSPAEKRGIKEYYGSYVRAYQQGA